MGAKTHARAHEHQTHTKKGSLLKHCMAATVQNKASRGGFYSQGPGWAVSRVVGEGEPWLNSPDRNRTFAEDRPGCADITWKLMEPEELHQHSRINRY